MKIVYMNDISEKDYNRLRKAVAWEEIPSRAAQTGLNNSKLIVVAVADGVPVGMARVLSDGGYIRYIADVIVHPDYQGLGIGRSKLNMIMSYIRESGEEGVRLLVCLLAAKGKEDFYMKFGFQERPNDDLGAGMSQWIEFSC